MLSFDIRLICLMYYYVPEFHRIIRLSTPIGAIFEKRLKQSMSREALLADETVQLLML